MTYQPETLAVHAGQEEADSATNARAVPIYQTTSYVFDDAQHAADLFALRTPGNIYNRIMNPTQSVLETRVNALEGGVGALATASGASAITYAVLNLTYAGDNIVALSTLYGGTFALFAHTLSQFGIEARFVDPSKPEDLKNHVDEKTKLVFGETVGNPALNVVDLDAWSAAAHELGLPFIVDNTVPTPYLTRVFDHGVDVAVHSATKYLGGHGTTMGGIVVESGKFPWDNGNFPQMTEPSRGYHGVRFFETFGDFGFTMKARMETMRTLGPTLSPFSAFLLLQGVETLHLRMPRHCASALAVARHLAAHPRVEWVRYPFLDGDRHRAAAQRYLPRGAGGILTFGIRSGSVGGARAGERFIEAVQFLSHLANVGDAKTLVIHPASTTHRQLSEDEQRAAGVTPEMIRLSVGLESADDILWDLDQALERSQQ